MADSRLSILATASASVLQSSVNVATLTACVEHGYLSGRRNGLTEAVDELDALARDEPAAAGVLRVLKSRLIRLRTE
jgi:hypothetical protein